MLRNLILIVLTQFRSDLQIVPRQKIPRWEPSAAFSLQRQNPQSLLAARHNDSGLVAQKHFAGLT